MRERVTRHLVVLEEVAAFFVDEPAFRAVKLFRYGCFCRQYIASIGSSLQDIDSGFANDDFAF